MAGLIAELVVENIIVAVSLLFSHVGAEEGIPPDWSICETWCGFCNPCLFLETLFLKVTLPSFYAD